MTKRITMLLLTLGLAVASTGHARAQEAKDVKDGQEGLQACIVRSATDDDRRALARWMFAALAKHPDLQDMGQVTQAQREAANKGMGAMMERLLTVECLVQAKASVQSGNADTAFQQAFGMLGQLAGESLFQDPNVSAEAAAIVRYVDMNKIVELFLP